MTEINNFSKKVGNDIINFQGSGGNISYKEEGFLYIKPSGYRIEDIYKKQLLSKIDIKGFYNDFESIKNLSEDILTRIIEKNNKSQLKSSIETGFHLLIDSKYVIHTHNVYINVLLCMEGGEKILRDLFGNIIDIIDYNAPGLGLFTELIDKNNFNSMILLKNHGIILHGNKSFIDLYEKINNIELIIKEKLELEEFKILDKEKQIRKHIFPDTIVIKDREVYSAHEYIKIQIKKIGGKIKYLSNEEVAYIRNMKTEKYRKKIFSKKNVCI